MHTFILIPGHSQIKGNERAVKLANLGGVRDTLDHEPLPPITQSVKKQNIQKQAVSAFEEKGATQRNLQKQIP